MGLFMHVLARLWDEYLHYNRAAHLKTYILALLCY